jgi:WD40 repeat protein
MPGDAVSAAAASPDGALVALGTRLGAVLLVDAASGRTLLALSLDDAVTALAWSDDGEALGAAGENGTLAAWSARGARGNGAGGGP